MLDGEEDTNNTTTVTGQENPLTTTEEKPAETTTTEGGEQEGKDGDEGATEGEGSTSGEGEQGARKDKQVPWFQKRIDKLTAKNSALQQQLETELSRQRTAAATREDPNAATGARKAPSSGQVDPEVMRLATQIVATEEFNKKCNNLVSDGQEKFEDFDEALTNMRSVGAVGPGADPSFISAVFELKDPTKIFHELGKNPDEAARILSLTPTRQVIELARLEERLSKPKPVVISKTPKPITPLGGGSAKTPVDLNDDKLPMDKWLAEREKTRKTRQ